MMGRQGEDMIDEKRALDLWREGNGAGEGFAVGEDSDDINEIEGLGELVARANTSREVAQYLDKARGILTLVGDANGPWAISIPCDPPSPKSP